MRVELSAKAEEDLDRIYEFNLERSVEWAQRVNRRLLERSRALAAAPFVGRLHRPEGVRQVSVTDIQYVIDYRPAATMIEILRFRSSREIR
ncbi:MAG: type II toxin-antitoxin system RelE/ParE family toxin [Allosphingosinicella sp.]